MVDTVTVAVMRNLVDSQDTAAGEEYVALRRGRRGLDFRFHRKSMGTCGNV